jgi:imidazolonepropionase-like amidohydrolase
MQSITYLFLTALLYPSVNGCLSRHQAQHELSASYIETQLKLLEARNQSPPTGKTALTNVCVFDGWGIGEPTTVVIEGGSITFDPRDVQNTIDGEGGVLLPGLIDSHIHLSSVASLEILSSYGVTTAINMGCSNYTLCSALRDQIGLTSFFSAGEGAVAPNSTHATVFGSQGFVYSPSQAPEFVADVFGNGSDFMKIISEPNGFNQATHDALVSATHALGKVSMTHAQDYGSYEVAIRSRTNGLQHVPFDISLTEEMAQRIKRQVQYVTPTLNIGKIVTSNSTLESIISSGVSLTYEAGVISVQRLMRAGVPILAGTDARDATDSFLENDSVGRTLHQELQYLTAAGMSEVDVLRAATVVPSLWHNLIGRGSIREGYRADLLLLRPGSNPLRNISKTLDIARVWNGGIEYVPTAQMK